MRLKHLSLQGYKSFANKTEFEFPPGITAIIGPNGTGKSNIADAIRWALGERSMSSLRAKATSDMIFAGGDGRARAGMAEVTLTFDNTDGGLPIEFSEVTISRRAYRSGENEYLMNGSQVLLRDIEELLAESSLSERTYTVIGQGVVDAALALRPQERRALFEEAAGITLYRDRREKTVERLDETERNLERVRDIIAEIAPRVRRLERDARQVEQHRRLSAHLERLQSTWYGYRWGQQQTALERTLERASGLEEQLRIREREVADAEQSLGEVREQESTLRIKLRRWYRQSGDLHEEVDKARRELAVSEERERLLKTRRGELLEEIEPLHVQREEQSNRVSQLRRRLEELEEEMAARRTRLSDAEQTAASYAEEARALEDERREAEETLRRRRVELDRLERAMREAQEEISNLASERAVAEERARQLESRREEVVSGLVPLGRDEEAQAEEAARGRDRLVDLERDLAEREQELADLKAAWETLQARAEEPSKERVRVEDQIQASRAEIERLESAERALRREEAEAAGRLKALERVHASGAAYDQGVETLRRADLEGMLGPLAGLIHVEPQWEQAVEAALASGSAGDVLQAVVVEHEAVVEPAHQALMGKGGRLTITPLDGPRTAVSAEELPPGALSAATVVRCDGRVRFVVDAFLGPVALCEDLAEVRALRSHMPAGSLCVTRRGLVVRADGAYVIGELGEGRVLADERARRELPARLRSIERRLETLVEERRAERQRSEALEAQLAAIDRRMSEAREEERETLRQRMGEAQTAVAVAREALRSQRAVVERETAELERIQGRREALEEQALDLRERYRAEVQRARAIQLALDVPLAAQPNDEEESGPARIPDAAEGFRRRLEEAHQRSRRLAGKQEAASERVVKLEDRLEQITRRAADARERAARFERETLSDARTSVAVLEASRNSERQTLERETALLKRLGSQVDARRERAAELKEQRENLLSRVGMLRQDAERLETDLRAVRERIQPAEETLEALEGEQASLEERRKKAQQRVREVEEQHGRAKLNVERRRDDLELLAERIEEDLGLVELELAKSVTAQSPLPMRPLVAELPVVEELPDGLKDEMRFVKKRLRRLGGVNPHAPTELAEVQQRYEFLTEQADDLEVATHRLRQSVVELDRLMEHAFQETFEAVAGHFSEMFHHLFQGGEARLTLTEPEELLHTGIDIVARPPGKRPQRLALLSGGERALTAVALLFSLLHVSPTPFCVLDEVDAMLDEANVGRFRAKLEDLGEQSQFIVITHNRNTVESADAVYGVSMGSNAVSQVVSLKLGQVRTAA